jgi:hypothetical protein
MQPVRDRLYDIDFITLYKDNEILSPLFHAKRIGNKFVVWERHYWNSRGITQGARMTMMDLNMTIDKVLSGV